MNYVLEIKGIYKHYENLPLLRGVTFSIAQGETVCILGPSGSGKSTLLRILAGLESAEKGEVWWDGQEIGSVPVHQRNFSLMFQDYALFPHLNVHENVAFGLRMRHLDDDQVLKRVKDVLALVEMQSFTNRRVTDLSGGEQQRVALARALAPQPRLLMLDEPLGALDRALKDQLSNELRGLLHKLGIPTIYVTHDQQEAFVISDRLVILHEGRVLQQGTAEETLSKPVTLWLANFLGFNNQLAGQIKSISPLKIETEQGTFTSDSDGIAFTRGQEVTILLKTIGAQVSHNKKDEENVLKGKVEDVVFRGESYLIKLRTDEGNAISFLHSHKLKLGEEIYVTFKPEDVLCYAEKHRRHQT